MAKKTKQGLSVGVFQIVTDMENGDPAVIAKHAEDLGFGSYWVPEHTVIPEGSSKTGASPTLASAPSVSPTMCG